MFPLVLKNPQIKSATAKKPAFRTPANVVRWSTRLRDYPAALRVLVTLIGSLSLLSACDSDVADEVAGEISSGEISLSIPGQIRSIRAIDLSNVKAIAKVNDTDYQMSLSDGKFRTAITVDPNTAIRVQLSFTEQMPNGTEIILARHAQVSIQVGANNQTVQFFDADYDTNFDRDGDNISNIDERNLGTDPLVFSPIPSNRILNVSFTLPSIVPNPQLTQVIVTYSGVPKAVSRSGNRFQITGSAPTSADITVETILLQRFNNQSVVMATATQFITAGVETQNILFNNNDFDFNKDTDGDGRSNVEELRLQTDPFVAD